MIATLARKILGESHFSLKNKYAKFHFILQISQSQNGLLRTLEGVISGFLFRVASHRFTTSF